MGDVEGPLVTSDGVCASRKSKETYVIAFAIVLHEESVRVFDVDSETAAYCHIKGSSDAVLEAARVISTNPRLIITRFSIIRIESARSGALHHVYD